MTSENTPDIPEGQVDPELEQQATSADAPEQETAGQETDPMDDWASALAEQTAATSAANQAQGLAESSRNPPNSVQSLFAPLPDGGSDGRVSMSVEALNEVPVTLTVELGRTRITIRELLQLGQGSVVDLTALAGEPLDVLINGHLIAQGEVVSVGENYGVRLTDIMTPSDRLQRLMPR